MSVDLPALRELLAKATPGPWKPSVWIETDGNEWRATGPGHEEHAHDYGSEPGSPDEQSAQADATLIVALVNAAPDLLDEVERLRARDEDQTALVNSLHAEAQRARTEAHDNFTAGCSIATDRERVYGELHKAEAEAARMRPVYEAACDVHSDFAPEEVADMTTSIRDLYAAVDAARREQ